MQEITTKELQMIFDALAAEGLLGKKARAYSNTLIDRNLAECMAKIADGHDERFNALLGLLGG